MTQQYYKRTIAVWRNVVQGSKKRHSSTTREQLQFGKM